jgi:hypothetical protein
VNWIGGSATWIGGTPPFPTTTVSIGTRTIGGTVYDCVLVTVG